MKIINIRKRSGLSQTDFGDKLGLSKQAISTYENGRDVHLAIQKLVNCVFEKERRNAKDIGKSTI